ncbi:GABA permease [Coccidioides immitis RMSCC 2394]|uniref:GABA permease n=1 Tax=Coccidioides immitis RMSCC 2394 TaxID=404692 RepID=A0A0J7B4U8_COCIT|nr:GABA permease [Coccidioides immitis RMSCC 2394]
MVLFNGRGKSCTTPVAGTAKDAEDMRRMNKLQELNRVYTTITLAGYSVILGLTWPFSLFTAALSLTNGGPAGAVWVYVGVCVAVFAPAKWRKLASYIVGWYPDVISAVPAPANVGGATIQAFAVVASPAYNPKPWHVVTLTIAICTLAVVFNTFCARKMPGIEGVVFALYILEFFAIFIILLVMGDRSSAREVFTVFQDNAGWGSVGTACFVGASGPVITMIGADSAVHLAEELKDASRHLPRAMMITASVNYLVGFMILLAAMFVVGNVKEVLETPTGAPWVQILLNATQDRKPVLVLMAFIIFFLLFCAINANTTSSRQLYAFARDGGLPYSEWISRVSPHKHVPANAVFLTWFIGCCIALIPLGSTEAFLNIQTIAISALLASYIVAIICRIHNRNYGSIYGNLSKPPPFFLGKIGGNVINILALMFLVCFLVAAVFPIEPHPTVQSMNWSSLALGSTLIIALVGWVVRGQKYLGPDVVVPVDDSNIVVAEPKYNKELAA